MERAIVVRFRLEKKANKEKKNNNQRDKVDNKKKKNATYVIKKDIILRIALRRKSLRGCKRNQMGRLPLYLKMREIQKEQMSLLH